MFAPWKQSYDQLRQHIKKQRHYFANKSPSSHNYGVSSSHVWMWELNYKESWGLKNWCFWAVVLQKTLESPLDCKEIEPVHPKGNQSWIFIGRTDAEAETPILWPPDAKNWLIGKDLDAGKDWRWEEKGTTEDKMVGWHHWLNRNEVQSTMGVGDGQGGLVCCSPWCHKELDTTEWLNWSELNWPTPVFLGFPCGSAGKESSCNVGDLGLIPGLGRCPGEGKNYPLQYSGLQNSMDYCPWTHRELDTTKQLLFSISCCHWTRLLNSGSSPF